MDLAPILIVDDESEMRSALSHALTRSGFRVETAVNGTDALVKLKKDAFSLVITDLKMPEMDGIDLLRRLKKMSPDTEVIMITGHGDMDQAIKSVKYEATDFVTKPINDEVLEIALNRAQERIAMRRKLNAYTQNLERLVRDKTRELVEAEQELEYRTHRLARGRAACIQDCPAFGREGRKVEDPERGG